MCVLLACPLSQLLGQAVILFHVWGPHKAHPDLFLPPTHTPVLVPRALAPLPNHPYPGLGRQEWAGLGRARLGRGGQLGSVCFGSFLHKLVFYTKGMVAADTEPALGDAGTS